jgi:hypothetical protein
MCRALMTSPASDDWQRNWRRLSGGKDTDLEDSSKDDRRPPPRDVRGATTGDV